MITRFGHIVILAIIAAAAVAVFVVLRADDADSPSGDDLPRMQVAEVINYSRFGVVDRIEVDGRDLTVHFARDFDVASTPLGTESKVFRATLDQGQDIRQLLGAEGIAIGGEGVEVTGE